MNTRELASHSPEVFDTLSEAYQADDCLFFWYVNGILHARPAEGQEEALGEWEAVFINNHWWGRVR